MNRGDGGLSSALIEASVVAKRTSNVWPSSNLYRHVPTPAQVERRSTETTTARTTLSFRIRFSGEESALDSRASVLPIRSEI